VKKIYKCTILQYPNDEIIETKSSLIIIKNDLNANFDHIPLNLDG